MTTKTNTRVRRAAVLLVTVLFTLSCVAAPSQADASTGPSPTYAVAEPLCAATHPGHVRCLGETLLRRAHPVPGGRVLPSRSADTSVGAASGPAGGYSPDQVSGAYGINPDTSTNSTVAVVDAYDDPNALADLNAFNIQYGLPAETAVTFQKVSQTGNPTNLPTPNAAWAGEQALDLDAVRGICHHCRIIVVEADTDADANLAAAENEAAALGADVITNSFGEPEPTTGPIPASITTAFNHPGVVITAGTGDDGMYSWDQANSGTPSANAPYFPASLANVVAVGGTTLQLSDTGARATETVWNENGQGDILGAFGLPFGATGGGCSTTVTAPTWQTATDHYAATDCGTNRLPADISALADPFTGYDVYNTYQSSGWQTAGGTSLASPLIAAMWALAGGAHGVTDPALTLYGHEKTNPTASLYDITDGGNGYCGGLDAADCESYAGQSPNTLGYGTLDCAFLPNSETTAPGTRSCDAAPGYDGPSGIGTPNTLATFAPLNPTPRVTTSTTHTTRSAAPFNGATSTDPFPGGTITAYRWAWGDGTSATGAQQTHRYAQVGTYTVTLTVHDNYQRTATTTRSVKVTATSKTTTTLNPTRLAHNRHAKVTAHVTVVGATTTGTVTVYDSTKKLTSTVLRASAHGTVTITLPTLKPGNHNIITRYSGSTYVAASTSTPAKLTVTR